MDIINEAYVRAQDVLRRCVSPLGFKASALPGGYPQVWGRDGPITSLGALLLDDADLIKAAKDTLVTLAEGQTELGMIPLNVHAKSGESSGENAGCVDANLWFIVGHFIYHSVTGDREFALNAYPALEKALLWLRYQDMNDCGLLEVPEAGNWADLLAVRYNTLYDNALYVAACRAMSLMPCPRGKEFTDYASLGLNVATRINGLMWLDRGWDAHEFAEHLEYLKGMRLEWYMVYHNAGVLSSRPYYLPFLAFRECGDYLDTFGNLITILLGIANPQRSTQILDYIHASGAESPYPAKAFFPPILPGDREWREYYRSRNLNLPHQYHNGGIWPFLGGLYVATLVHSGRLDVAEETLARLATSVAQGRRGPWEFNEWLHGVSGRPMGHPFQAWSAGMYVFAYHALRDGRVPVLPSISLGTT